MFKYRRNRVLALCAGERRLLTKALLSFRNKLVASVGKADAKLLRQGLTKPGKGTGIVNELLIRLLR